MAVNGPAEATARSILKPVSLLEASVQVSLAVLFGISRPVNPDGAAGGAPRFPEATPEVTGNVVYDGPAFSRNVKAATLIADAFAGVLFGWLSDITRSRWGRRRPYILVGSLLSGLALPLLFLPSRSWDKEQIFSYMLLSAVLYSPLIASYNSAYQALGAELTPDYHERANVMGYKAIVQKTVGILIGGAVWLSGLPLFRDPATGEIDSGKGAMAACLVSGLLMIASGVISGTSPLITTTVAAPSMCSAAAATAPPVPLGSG